MEKSPEGFLDTITHLETPENVHLAFHLAGPGSRLGAYLIDLLLRLVLLYGFAMTLGMVLLPLAGGVSGGIFLVLVFLLEWGYGSLFEGLWNGQTPGKRMLGLRVIKAEGYAVGFYEAMLRNLLRVADALPAFYALGLLATLSTRRMQRIGDLAAGTIVVRERRRALRDRLSAAGVLPLSPGEIEARYRPSPRTLDTIESLFRRSGRLSPERTDEIAAILAAPLARRLGYTGPLREVHQRPSEFLLRVLGTFQDGEEESTAYGHVASPASAPRGADALSHPTATRSGALR